MLYKCKPIRKNAGINFAFGETVIHANFAFKIKKQSPIQLDHSPEDIQEFVDVFDA
tara:strand:+ start:48 stop:215 length:168 start_codon:yes stop_codon:yes gene_type:complete